MSAFGINQVKQGLELKFFALCEKIAGENQLDLYDLHYLAGQSLLRVFIMDQASQTALIEDCVRIDQALTPYMEEDWVPETLTVEVSSPGVFRQLRETKHFESSIGKRVSVTIMGELEQEQMKDWPKSLKGKKKFVGLLESASENGIKLEVENTSIIIEIKYKQIKKSQWEPKF